jgi:hypothetical protein
VERRTSDEGQRVNIKLDKETGEAFRKRAKARGLPHITFLRHLLDQNERLGVSSVRDPDGELLVTYSAVIHQPIRLQGTVEKWSPTPDEEPVDEEEAGDDQANGSDG